MESLLQGIAHVTLYIDDILITGKTKSYHLQSLEECFKVAYLGYVNDAEGLHPLLDNVQAIQQAPTLRSVMELKSYLGLLTYYGKFLHWLHWTSCLECSCQSKTNHFVSRSNCSHPHNCWFTLILSFIYSWLMIQHWGSASQQDAWWFRKTNWVLLPNVELNWMKLFEKKGLSCAFGVKLFYWYLFGHHFTLIEGHKPLLGFLSEQKLTSPARIAWSWSLYLSMFEYTLYRNSGTPRLMQMRMCLVTSP